MNNQENVSSLPPLDDPRLSLDVDEPIQIISLLHVDHRTDCSRFFWTVYCPNVVIHSFTSSPSGGPHDVDQTIIHDEATSTTDT